MASGRVTIDVKVDDKEVMKIDSALDKVEKKSSSASKSIDGVNSSVKRIDGKSVDKLSSGMNKTSESSSKASQSVNKVSEATRKIDGKAVLKLGNNMKYTVKDGQKLSEAVNKVRMSEQQIQIKRIEDLRAKLNQTEKSGNKAENSVLKLAKSIGLVAIASKAFDVLKNSMDAAISRFDTFNTYPKVMKALGYNTQQSTNSINDLAQGIEGVPTKLDDVVNTAKRMTSVTGNLDRSTQATIALNNAMLASGASTEDANRGMEQYIQMLSTGKVDMQSWRTLQETMPIGLTKTAKAMGFVGEAAQNDLYVALRDGDITFKDFQKSLIELGTGTGELAKLAKINSEGIATSFTNLKTTASKGLANLLTQFDELSVAVTGKNIAKNIDGLKTVVNVAFKAMGAVVTATTPLFKLFATTLGLVGGAAKVLAPELTGLVVAITAFKIMTSIQSLWQKQVALFKIAEASSKTLAIATTAQVAAQKLSTDTTKADMAVTAASNGLIKIRTLLVGLLSGSIGLAQAKTILLTQATVALKGVMSVLSGPIGWVTAALGAIVAVSVAVVKIWKTQTEEGEKLSRQMEDMSSETDSLTESIKSNSTTRKEDISTLKSNAEVNKTLIDSLEELANKENKSSTEKKLMKDTIDDLNNQYSDLNLRYVEESEGLSISADLLRDKTAAYAEQEKAIESQRQLTEIMREQRENEFKLKETAALREVWNQKLEEGTVKGWEAKEAFKELDEQEEKLGVTAQVLSEEYSSANQTMVESTQAADEALTALNANQESSLFSLTETQAGVVESMQGVWQGYLESATDMFSTLSEKQELSAAEMAANMEENQRVIGQWAENIATLTERGVDQGLLDKLREAGPASAGHVWALVNASDQELERMNSVFQNGGDTATKALETAFDTGKAGVGSSVMGLVTTAETSLRNQIKASDFQSIGKNVPEGVAKGVESGTGEAVKSAEQMAQKMDKGFTGFMQIQSPSRLFMQHGQHITQGVANGVQTGAPQAVNATRQMAQAMVESVQFLQPQMQQIGIYAMYGMANGLYAGAGAAYNAARNIATNIQNIIQSAFDIHSPSRWMRDMIGKNIPKGIAIGIESDAPKALKAMSKMSDDMKTITTPEMALGTGKMNFGGFGNQTTNNTTSKSYEPTINITVENAKLDSSRSIEDTSEQLAVLTARQLRGRLELA